MSLYAKDGVDIEAGDSFSSAVYRICKRSWENSPYVEVVDLAKGHFRGPRGDRYVGLPEGCVNLRAPDGVGTKVVVHASARTLLSAASDIFAMTCGDITRWGGLPLVFSNVLDVETLEGESRRAAYLSMFEELAEVAQGQGVVLMGGETAELGNCVGSEYSDSPLKFNWAGYACGVVTPAKLIDGSKMEPGDVVVALKEDGFRSNGVSSVRKALRSKFGDLWYKNLNEDARKAVKEAAVASVSYDRLMATANGWFEPGFAPLFNIKCIAHISGGGIPGKFGRDILFPLGLNAELDDLWDPPEIMQKCAQWRGMPARECYEVWNGGQGMLVVLPKREVDNFLKLAAAHNRAAKVCGAIFPCRGREPTLILYSKFEVGAIEYH